MTLVPLNPAAHGSGPVAVSTPGYPTDMDGRVVNASRASAEFPLNNDPNAGSTLGIGAHILFSHVTTGG